MAYAGPGGEGGVWVEREGGIRRRGNVVKECLTRQGAAGKFLKVSERVDNIHVRVPLFILLM